MDMRHQKSIQRRGAGTQYLLTEIRATINQNVFATYPYDYRRPQSVVARIA
jgi:hypothetical protein